ncbi:MAG: glycosyltransferase [Magnetococcales bacterium]|nr:glycosyltransferase [Magnetococcales bacterium]MBF0115667.1 glycosyltransferase [Magnetococcales bacterium]
MNSASSSRRQLTGTACFDVPIFINSYNRLECLQKLVEWLENAGYHHIYIVDNNSSYPPLLDYLRTIENRVHVIRLHKNFGYLALWRAEILKSLDIRTEYVYTDPDVVPEPYCPPDFISHFQRILAEHPYISNVGFSLSTTNIDLNKRDHDAFYAFALNAWRRPLAPGLWLTKIDTTFALYRPGAMRDGFTMRQTVTTSYPYMAQHLGWDYDPDFPTDEDLYYINSGAAQNTSSYSTKPIFVDPKSPELTVCGQYGYRGDRMVFPKPEQPAIIHLGCGEEYIHGWINLDGSGSRLDICCDLESIRPHSLTLAEGSIHGIYGCQKWAEVPDLGALMLELYRLAMPEALFVARVSLTPDPVRIQRLMMALFAKDGDLHHQLDASLTDSSRADCHGGWTVREVKLVMRQSDGERYQPERTLAGEEFQALIRVLPEQVQEVIIYWVAKKGELDSVVRTSDPLLCKAVYSALQYDISWCAWEFGSPAIDRDVYELLRLEFSGESSLVVGQLVHVLPPAILYASMQMFGRQRFFTAYQLAYRLSHCGVKSAFLSMILCICEVLYQRYGAGSFGHSQG